MKRQSNDDALAERELLQKMYVEASRRNELKKHMQSIVREEKHKTTNQRKVWLAAASITILIGIGTFFIFHPKHSFNNIIRAKQENESQEGLFVTGTENKIPEFGSVDTFNLKNKNIEAFLPADGVVFQQNDTILFSRKETTLENVLLISDTSGSIIKKIIMQSGSAEYKLLPYTLKPGKYFWNYMQNGVPRSFKIE
jgi:cytoskeletal protein RodZ